MSTLTGKVVIITGASSGIGNAIAKQLGAKGAKLVLAAYAVETFGQIDALVNNAGIMPSGFLNIDTSDEWDALIDINIKGVLYNIGAVFPYMREKRSGHIINVSSIAAYVTTSPYAIVYSMTKHHAVREISEGVRQQEAIFQSNIRVTDVGPGTIDTDLKYTITDPQMREAAMQQYSDKSKMLTADELAATVVYAMELPENVSNTLIVRPSNT